VIGIRGSLVVRPVTRIAVCRRTHILPVNVALRTRHRCVSPGQRECGRLMVEGGRLPRYIVMTNRAIVREILG
jgi:hypothetical protein